jgi:hypothetical protein
VTETKEINQEEVETAPVRTEFTKLDEDSERAYDEYVDRLQENVDKYVERLVEENRNLSAKKSVRCPAHASPVPARRGYGREPFAKAWLDRARQAPRLLHQRYANPAVNQPRPPTHHGELVQW